MVALPGFESSSRARFAHGVLLVARSLGMLFIRPFAGGKLARFGAILGRVFFTVSTLETRVGVGCTTWPRILMKRVLRTFFSFGEPRWCSRLLVAK